MLTFIKTNYQIGDKIEVTCTEGTVTGQIEYVTGKYIVLRQSNGQICGIAATDVCSFRAQSPVQMVPAQGQTSVIKAPVYATEELRSVSNTNPNVASCLVDENKDEVAHQFNSGATANTVEDSDNETIKPQTLRDVIGDEKPIDSADQLTGATPVAEPKVVGHIDLASIDPNYGRRNYFRSEAQQGNNNETLTSAAAPTPTAWQTNNSYQPKSFVAARGRITYYNSMKRFGFIHDYSTDSDLYFYIQQIVDNELLDQLHKGTKVVYGVGHNSQGAIATCIHLPNTASNLCLMAEDAYDARHYYAAKGLIEHILDADPDNVEAKQLLEDIEAITPQNTSEYQRGELQPYNPCLLYSQAKKAYLSKKYEESEALYMKALEANEKPESCVKDLLTLYVSLYKQTNVEAERVAIRQKANHFFSAHQHLLPNNLTTKQFLALNYYLPIQDNENFLAIVNSLLTDPQVESIVSRRVFYMWQKSITLNKMGRTDEALEVCNEGLKLSPYNRQLANLRDSIQHPTPDEVEADSPTPSVDEAAPTVATEAIDGDNNN